MQPIDSRGSAANGENPRNVRKGRGGNARAGEVASEPASFVFERRRGDLIACDSDCHAGMGDGE
jgi:hypothetical protein